MRNYQDLLKYVLDSGVKRNDRTGVGTFAVFPTQLEFDLRNGFPAVTTKKLYFKSVAAELIGFLKGYDNAKDYRDLGTKIWDANSNADYWQKNPNCKGPDDMGRVYGVQWRSWRRADGSEMDQLREVVDRAKITPHDRRLCVTAWNPGELAEQCLPPCHLYFQLFVDGPHLDLFFLMRSVDLFLGAPFDIASYALLQHVIGRELYKVPRKLHMTFLDSHIYANHIDQVRSVLSREPYRKPRLHLDESVTGIDDFNSTSQVKLLNYQHWPAIDAPMAL